MRRHGSAPVPNTQRLRVRCVHRVATTIATHRIAAPKFTSVYASSPRVRRQYNTKILALPK